MFCDSSREVLQDEYCQDFTSLLVAGLAYLLICPCCSRQQAAEAEVRSHDTNDADDLHVNARWQIWLQTDQCRGTMNARDVRVEETAGWVGYKVAQELKEEILRSCRREGKL